MFSCLLSDLYSLLWGFLRMWYGGSLREVPILRNRGVQSTVMILSIIPIFYCYGFWIALITACYLVFGFWSRAHGPMFDYGRDKHPSPETIERYKKMWGYDLACKIFPESLWYSRRFDAFLMDLRYILPMIIPAIFYLSWTFIIIGALIGPIYGTCWYLKDEDIIKSEPTKIAEFFSGIAFGFIWFVPNPETYETILSLTFGI